MSYVGPRLCGCGCRRYATLIVTAVDLAFGEDPESQAARAGTLSESGPDLHVCPQLTDCPTLNLPFSIPRSIPMCYVPSI